MIKSLLHKLRYPLFAIFAILASGCRDEAGSVDFVQQPEPMAQDTDTGTVAFADAEAAGERPGADRLNRTAKQAFLKANTSGDPVELDSLVVPVKMVKKGSAIKSEPPLLPLRHTKTKLVAFESAPFPYRGVNPNSGRPFLDVSDGGRRGHRTSSGEVYWEDRTYSDARVLLHIPRGFDLRRPALMVIFLHGHGAMLQRDVIERQRVPEQVSEAGVNAVLVAPQLASNAADSSAGKLWEPGGFQRFLDEASVELANAHGDPRSRAYFDKMPIVIVAYSGGYMTAASCIRHGGAGSRLRGIVLLDALYGDMDTFANWISTREKSFFLSAYANSTRARNTELASLLKGHDVIVSTKLKGPLRGGSVTFISTAPETEHRDFVTQAWTHHPIKDLLQRLRVEAK
ncbi:MAG TPA: alpha/beta hydrolase [Rhodomicrobium sp.]|nr:alpha/beta hydrolase [Rhodomicrobium sp.]